MTLTIIFVRIIGVVIILLGCLLMTRRKFIISRQINMILLCIVLFMGNALNPMFTYEYILILAAFHLFMAITCYVVMKGRYTISNMKKEILMPIITRILDERAIVYVVTEDEISLTNFNDKKIKCMELLNGIDINFREIRKFPFYAELKNTIFSVVKRTKEVVFPKEGVFNVFMGLALLIVTQIIFNGTK